MCGELSGGRGLRLALEATQQRLGLDFVARTEDLGSHELDGGVARQQLVFGPPHLAHPAAPEPLDQVVAAQRLRIAQPTAELVKHLRRQHRDDGARVVGPRPSGSSSASESVGTPRRCASQTRQRIERRRDQRRIQHLARRVRRHHRVDQDHDRDPREVTFGQLGRRRHGPRVQRRDRRQR